MPRTGDGAKVRVNVDLQDDFSMDQTLSLYLLETLPLLDPESPDYALDVLTLVESILENPDLILRKQLDRIKDRAVAQMKADGVEYEQRMEELEKLEYPKPLRDFVYETFNAFADRHPWVGEENIRPKSIAREMFENFRSFAEYVLDYELQRSEGLLLRHLNSVYKVLSQTVPDGVKNDEVREMELYLRTLLRQVDSSLEDEWERMRDPAYRPFAPAARPGEELRPPVAETGPPDITRDAKAFTAAIRTRIFTFLRAWAIGDHAAALGALDDPPPAGIGADAWTLGAAPISPRGLPRRPRTRPPRSRGAQRPAHARRAVRRRAHVARAAGARRPGAAQRLDGGVGGGGGGLARGEPAGAVAAWDRSDRVGVQSETGERRTSVLRRSPLAQG